MADVAILGEGIVQIRADFARFRQQMSGFAPQVQQSGSAAGSAFGGAFVGSLVASGALAGARAFLSVFEAVRDGALAFTASAIGSNAQMERMKTSFEVLTGSAGRADKLLREITTFARDTPFEIPGLTQAATQLLAANVQAENVLPMLRKIGDAAAGSAQGFAAFPRMTLAISQMLSAGKVGGQDMLQLAQAGVPAWDLLAKKMGLSTGELRKLSEQGKLGKDSVYQLIDALGARFEGMTSRQAGTFEGLVAKLSDSWNIMVMKVGKPVFDVAKDSLAGLVAMFDSPSVEAFGSYLTGGLQSFFDALRHNAARSGEIFTKLFSSDWFSSFLTDGQEVIALVSELAWNFQQFSADLLDGMASSALWKVLGSGIDYVMDGLKQGLEAIAIFSADFDNAWRMIGLGGEILSEEVGTYLATMFLRAKVDAQNWALWMIKAFKELSKAIATVWTGTFDGMLKSVDGFNRALELAREGKFSTAMAVFSTTATSLGKGIMNSGEDAAAGFQLPELPGQSTATVENLRLDSLRREFASLFSENKGIRDDRILGESAADMGHTIGRSIFSALGWFNENLIGNMVGPEGAGGGLLSAKDAPKFVGASEYARGIQERLTPASRSEEVEAVSKVEVAVREAGRKTGELMAASIAKLTELGERFREGVGYGP